MTFPKKPEDCKRHRWLTVMHIPTLTPVEPRREQCWHCGTARLAAARKEGPR